MVFLLSILGMICWGVAPVFAKLGLKDVNPLSLLLVRTMFASIMIIGWFGMSGSVNAVKSVPFNAWWLIAVEAILATLVGDLAYFAAIKKGDISVITIIMASSPVVTMVCASIFLGEQITFMRVIGALFVISGIALVL